MSAKTDQLFAELALEAIKPGYHRREALARAVKELPNRQARAIARILLSDPWSINRADAIDTLEEIGNRQDLASVRTLANDEDHCVRCDVIEFWSLYPSTLFERAMFRYIRNDPHPVVRKHAWIHLVADGAKEAVDEAIEKLLPREKNSYVLAFAYYILVEWGWTEWGQALRKLAAETNSFYNSAPLEKLAESETRHRFRDSSIEELRQEEGRINDVLEEVKHRLGMPPHETRKWPMPKEIKKQVEAVLYHPDYVVPWGQWIAIRNLIKESEEDVSASN